MNSAKHVVAWLGARDGFLAKRGTGIEEWLVLFASLFSFVLLCFVGITSPVDLPVLVSFYVLARMPWSILT